MILVDPRAGSRELIPLLEAYGSPRRIPVQLAAEEMPAGDFLFEGNGPYGRVRVGVERKTIPDLINSRDQGRLMGTGKSPGQVHKMMEQFDYSWLLVEGIWRGNPETGLLETGNSLAE